MTTLASPDPVPAESAASVSPRYHRVVGEGTPRWLATAMALIGTSVAVAVVWLAMTEGRSTGAGRGLPAPPAAGVPGSPGIEWAAGGRPVPGVPRSDGADAPAGASSSAGPVPPPPVSAGSAAPVPPLASLAAPSSPGVARPGGAAGVSTPSVSSAGGASVAAGASPTVRDCPPELTVIFGFDSAVPAHDHIGGEGAPLLRWLAAHPGAKLSVQGHADAAGSDQHNLLLSYRRARAVAAQLGSAGVGGQRLLLTAAGSHEPIDGLPAAARENRRAVVRVKGYEDCEHASR